ncbi:hypothetical protein H4Q26_017375 [Puccinia striiformis f. sp. tritici PST-130]|nr:hypothetical protein H4Q26_017375 [Puccinia striiformis f. sp. tritici PST-130]
MYRSLYPSHNTKYTTQNMRVWKKYRKQKSKKNSNPTKPASIPIIPRAPDLAEIASAASHVEENFKLYDHGHVRVFDSATNKLIAAMHFTDMTEMDAGELDDYKFLCLFCIRRKSCFTGGVQGAILCRNDVGNWLEKGNEKIRNSRKIHQKSQHPQVPQRYQRHIADFCRANRVLWKMFHQFSDVALQNNQEYMKKFNIPPWIQIITRTTTAHLSTSLPISLSPQTGLVDANSSERSRFKEYAGKRAVENKNLGPIVKTVMTRCIQCAVVSDRDLHRKTLNSELSGNIIDLCPVGALTSKPYAFTARPWELKLTESIDVMDGLGSNIQIDSRGLQVMRIQPRINEDVNEEWIHDKTRYAYDGLKTQRLTTPLIKTDGKFEPATWAEALTAVAEGLNKSGAKNNEIKAIASALADTESLVALKDLINKLGSDNTALENPSGDAPPVHGVDFRQNYSFTRRLHQPRHEAAVLNSRFRRSWLNKGLQVGLIGQKFDSVFEFDHLGSDLRAVKEFVAGTGKFAESFKKAKKPMIIIGSAVNDHVDGHEIFKSLAGFVDTNKAQFLTPEWNGFNILQRTASSTAAYDTGSTPSNSASKAQAKFIYLLNADDFDPSTIPKDAFVVYQGHHGDLGASYADVCLPGTAYTEKSATWVNTEGRSQMGRTAVSSPGSSREDWKIIRAISEVLNVSLPYDDPIQIRNRMWEVCPSLIRYDELVPSSTSLEAIQSISSSSSTIRSKSSALKTEALGLPIHDFYFTDPISRASITMAQCSKAFSNPNTTVSQSDKSDEPMAAFG